MDGNTPALMQSEKERAPWNENKVQERTFKMSVDCTFRKEDIEVTTDDYIPYDEEGVLCENTEFTDWKRAYENNHYTIPELLDVLKVVFTRKIYLSVQTFHRPLQPLYMTVSKERIVVQESFTNTQNE